MRFDNYLKFLITLSITAILLMIWFSKGHAEVEGVYDDLNTDLWDDKGIIKVETGNETYDAVKIKLNDEEGVLKSDIKERWLTPDGQWCFVTVVIKQEGDTITKQEVLHCADTKHGITKNEKIKELEKQIELEKARKPGYWELFAEFYYRDINAPLYCRKYAKPKGLFSKTGTVCLTPTGKWEVM